MAKRFVQTFVLCAVMMLIVVDNDGMTGHVNHGLVVVRCCMPPAAEFTCTVEQTTVHVDGSISHDPEEHIMSYDWSYGEGATVNGVTATHTYATAGFVTITLVVTDDDGQTGSANKSIQIPILFMPPVASFTFTISG